MNGKSSEWVGIVLDVYVCVYVWGDGVHIGADCTVSRLTKVNEHNEEWFMFWFVTTQFCGFVKAETTDVAQVCSCLLFVFISFIKNM